MKTKTFFILCLLLGIVFTQLSAQNANNGNGSDVSWLTWDTYYIPVFSSSGEQIDILFGPVTYHNLGHFENGLLTWFKQNYHGEVESVGFINNAGVKIGGTGEIFSIKDQFSGEYTSIITTGSGHYNANGDQGSHYIVLYEYQFDWITFTETFSFVKAFSPGTKK
jgi:hypothetical protein